ncbi:hypothetical protein ASH01_14310 [Terrabacter sp. Soil811]|nr:hypothetical protein ASH01_14310 [Terrabacter sp. Soil811]
MARLLHVSVDRAREYTYQTDFPAPFVLGARHLWDRKEVLDWVRRLPRRPRTQQREMPKTPADGNDIGTGTGTGTDTTVVPATPSADAESVPLPRPIKDYSPRAERSVSR